MSETEKHILETIKKAMPNMSDFDKGYLLGLSESKAGESRAKKKAEEKKGE